MELIRAKASMSSKIVAKDKEYGYYSGAPLEIAEKMALIDAIKKTNLVPNSFIPILDLYRIFLDQKRKAFFASAGSTEITKLGFILGKEGEMIDADLPF
jgi:hypothetical protein